MYNIATLDNISAAIDTGAKFVRVVAKEGVTAEQFRLPIDDQMARRNLAAFLKNGCQFVIKGPSVLVVDRTKPFDPAKFIGNGLSIWRGPKNGKGLEGGLEQDERALSLAEVDFTKVAFQSFHTEGESTIDGEEKLLRMEADTRIRLDAKVGQALIEEKGKVTLRFLHDTYGITWFELAGTVLRSSYGRRCFLRLGRQDDGLQEDGSWGWSCHWLGSGRNRGVVSPLLAS